MSSNIVEVFTEINDLFNFENSESHLTKSCPKIREIKLQPYLQGNIDNLCGLYALINATRLVIYPSKIQPELLSKRKKLEILLAKELIAQILIIF